MGHHSAGFTLDTYGHLMESAPKRQVEWIDELVFPEGFESALNLHLYSAPIDSEPCSSVLSGDRSDPLYDGLPGSVVPNDAEQCVVPPARFELALPA